MENSALNAKIQPVKHLLASLEPTPRKILVVRCAPPAMFDPLLESLGDKFPAAEIVVFCHENSRAHRQRCIIYPHDGFFRSEHAPLLQLQAENFELLVLPYATDRRDAPFYHNVDRIAVAAAADKIVIVFRDNAALLADNEYFERKEREIIRPWLSRRDRAIGEVCAFTGEKPAVVLEKCELAGLRAVRIWQETGPRTEQQVRSYYSNHDFYVYELIKTEYNDDRRELVDAALAECEPGRTLLDYGGGVGIFSIPLAQKGCLVTHLDLPGALLEFARHRFASRGLEASFIAATVEKPLTARYEIILSVFVIEHLVDPSETLTQLERQLAPGGKLLLAVDFEDRREADELLSLHLTHLGRDEYYARMEQLGLVRLRSHRELDVFMRRGEI